jgi:hypothetical protein
MSPTATELPTDATTAEQRAAKMDKDGRAGNGQFGKGNPGGPGNPFARQTAILRQSIREVATAEEMKAVAAMLVAKAKDGNLAAAKLLLEHAIGKPAPCGDPDRLDIEELKLFKESIVDVQTGDQVLRGMPAGHYLLVARAVVPTIAGLGLAKLGKGIAAADARAARHEHRQEERRKTKEDRREERQQSDATAPSPKGENGPDQPIANRDNGSAQPAPNGGDGPDEPIGNGGNGPKAPPPKIGRLLRPLATRNDNDPWFKPPANGGNGGR